MESFQSVGLVVGIAGVILGLAEIIFLGLLRMWIAAISFIGIIISLFNPKHSKAVGIVLIVVGVLGNIFLVIPGIMALRYKPESAKEL
jgi:hypothetical protein